MVDKIAYWLAVLTVIAMPGAILYWFIIHPFAAFWRKLGRLPTYLIVFAMYVAVGYGFWLIREPFLRVRYGFNPVLSSIGLGLYLVSVYLEIQCRRHLKFYILAGAPELSKDDPGQLLDQGIYGRIRHPRYLSLLFGMTGVALFINYQGIYLLLLVCLPAVWLIILLEERELRERFGQAYVDYSARVPRFLPRRR